MQLEKLILRNFQGIREFELDIKGKSVSIFSDNGVGKTTLYSAFTWLLFGKNSLGATDFAIETLDTEGAIIHGLDHIVEGVFDINGTTLTLKRNIREAWGDKKGEKSLKGHTTDYWIDGVPGIKESEYKAKIASIVDEKTFRLLTDPRYFNEVLPWLERRELLIKVVGDVKDEDVIASEAILANLPSILGNHTLEDYKKIVKAREKAINEELSFIPKRIDEVHRGLSEVSVHLTIPTDLKSLRDARNTKAQELANLEAGGGIAEKTKELREVEAELIRIQKEYWLRSTGEVQTAKVELRKIQDKADDLRSTIKAFSRMTSENNQQIKTIKETLKFLQEEWHKANNKVLIFEDTEICPTCGQIIPQERIVEIREKALAAFNLTKAKGLENINNEGKRTKEKHEVFCQDNAKIEQEIAKHQGQLSEIEKKVADADVKIKSLEIRDAVFDPEYLRLEINKQDIENQIADLKTGNTGAVKAVKQELQELDIQIGECEATIAQISQREKGLARIEELKTQEKQLSGEKEKLESELFLMEKFTRTRVEMLEDKINAKFKLARFKMFNILVNGSIEECCETTYLGVPYASLNHGAQVNVSLDSINTFQDFYNFHPVVWIDRRESVTKLIPMECQIISLIVSEPDKALRIVKGESKEAEMTPSQRRFEHRLDKIKEET